MVYRNPEKQEMTETLKSNKEFAKLTQVKESRQNTFNIVSHQGPPRRIEAMLTAQKAERIYRMRITSMHHYYMMMNILLLELENQKKYVIK